MEDNVQHGNKVHEHEHCRDSIQTVYEPGSTRGDAYQHEGNAQFDWNDRCAVEYLEEEEILGQC